MLFPIILFLMVLSPLFIPIGVAVVPADLEPVAAAEHRELTVADRSPLGTDAPSPGKHVDERIEGPIPRQLQSRARRNGGMDQCDGRVCRPWASVATDLAGNDPN